MHALLKDCFVDRQNGEPRFAQFWHSGIDFRLLNALAEQMSKKWLHAELEGLYQFLEAHSGLEQWQTVPGAIMPIAFGQFDFIGLSPPYNRLRDFNRREVADVLGMPIADLRMVRQESNHLSSILVLVHRRLPVNIVLGGDAPTEVWAEALEAWDRLLPVLKRRQGRFAAVKVSHHGANGSKSDTLYQDYCRKGKTIAILSVGPNDPSHPHPDVLALLKSRRIRTYATCWKASVAAARPRSVLPLPGTADPAQNQLQGYDWADIEVSVRSDGRLVVYPTRALQRL